MKYLLTTLLLTLMVLCLFPQETKNCFSVNERPVVNVPLSLRQENWTGSADQGSCVYATMVSLLRWQGRYKTADDIRRTCGNGANDVTLAQVLDEKGVRFAYTSNGDVKFLEWSIRTRRGAGVSYPGRKQGHFIALIHLDAQNAVVLDNNDVDQYKVIPREEFLQKWRAQGGWAFAVIYTPPSPLPVRLT